MTTPVRSDLYLGSPGRMLALPQPKPGLQPARTRYNVITRGLDGTGTETLFGTSKRTYSVDLPYCTPIEKRWLRMCWENAIQPLWFIDPLTPNRMPIGVADTSSTLRGERKFTNTGGAITSVVDRPTTELTAPPRSVRLASGTKLSYAGVLALPGETLTFLSWSYATQTITPSVTFLGPTGTVIGTVHSGTTIASGSTFVKSVLTVAVPTGAATATYTLTLAASGILTTSQWRAGADGGTEWDEGGGAYRVAMTGDSGSSDRYPLETVTIQLEEL